ncbi:MAG: hypothetical protein ACR2G5_16775, partial [Pyrinomonadaceae bacterium]
AALTAARELDGSAAGIDEAVARANAIGNTQGLRAKAGVAVATVEFAVNLDDDPYVNVPAAKANAANIRFVKVTTQPTSINILFASSALGASRSESKQAVAGKSVGLSGICDFFPAAVALADPSPTPGTPMTLKFSQGTGNSATLLDKDYIILEVPDINGNGTGETAVLTAGVPTFCKNLGDNINMTPSSNKNNGPRNSGDGMNTRFNVYANGYGNALKPSVFPPDSNINESITYAQYADKSPLTAPNPNAPGKDERRLMIAPIIAPGTYPSYTTNILAWGIFFLKSKVPTTNGSCPSPCGEIPVEYVGKANVAASGVVTCTSGLTTPVLYK